MSANNKIMVSNAKVSINPNNHCPGAVEQCSSFDQQVDLGAANFSVKYDVTSSSPPRVHFQMSDGKTFTLNLPTASALSLEEYISADGYKKTLYETAGTEGLVSDLGINSASSELIIQCDKDADQIKVFSASKTAGRVPLATSSALSTIGLSSTDGSFRVTLTTDSAPICHVVQPEPGKWGFARGGGGGGGC